MYTILCPERDALEKHLTSHGIGVQKIYATPVPMQPCYANLNYTPSDVPVSQKCANELLCLPVFPELREDEVRVVADAIRSFYEKG